MFQVLEIGDKNCIVKRLPLKTFAVEQTWQAVQRMPCQCQQCAFGRIVNNAHNSDCIFTMSETLRTDMALRKSVYDQVKPFNLIAMLFTQEDKFDVSMKMMALSMAPNNQPDKYAIDIVAKKL